MDEERTHFLRALFADAAVALVVTLVVGLVIASLAAAGIITLSLALVLLLLAWIVGVLGSFLLPLKIATRHRIIFSVCFGIMLVLVGFYEIAKYEQPPTAKTIASELTKILPNGMPLGSPIKITEVTNQSTYRALPTDEWIAVKKSEKANTTVILPTGFPRGKVIVIKNSTEGNPAINPVMVHSETGPIDGFEKFPVDVGSASFLWDGNRWTLR